MNLINVPRKHRKHVQKLINNYKDNLGHVNHYFTNWDEFLLFIFNGTNDGWLTTSDKEYQALLWLIDITDTIDSLKEFSFEEESH